MGRLLIWTDLHDGHWRGFDLPDAGVLGGPMIAVLVGDGADTGGRHLAIPARAAHTLGCPVIAVWSHEPHDAAGRTCAVASEMSSPGCGPGAWTCACCTARRACSNARAGAVRRRPWGCPR